MKNTCAVCHGQLIGSEVRHGTCGHCGRRSVPMILTCTNHPLETATHRIGQVGLCGQCAEDLYNTHDFPWRESIREVAA